MHRVPVVEALVIVLRREEAALFDPCHDRPGKALRRPQLRDIGARHRGLPRVLLGHSMGSFALQQYLLDQQQAKRVIDFAAQHIENATPHERFWMLMHWAVALQEGEGIAKVDEAVELLRSGIRQTADPEEIESFNYNIVANLAFAGREEEAVHLVAGVSTTTLDDQADGKDALLHNWEHQRSLRVAGAQRTGGTGLSTGGNRAFTIAFLDLMLHDLRAAEVPLTTTRVRDASLDDAFVKAADQALLASQRGRVSDAIAAWDTFFSIQDVRVWGEADFGNLEPWCFAALDYERAGMPQKADAALLAGKKIVGTDEYVDCKVAHGDLADLRGDWAGAEAWYGKAITLAPSLPAGYHAWGAALLRHGKPDAAIKKFKLAHERGPHWADPLEGWGEALLTTKPPAEAAAKFAEAEPLAPQWGRLHQQWGLALEQAGRASEALVQYKKAAELELPEAEHREVLARIRALSPS